MATIDKKGFTLVELLIVVAIIGILAAIAIPMYSGQRSRAAASEAKANLESLRLLAEQYYAENGAYSTPPAADGTVYYFNETNCKDDPTLDSALCIRRALYRGFKPGTAKALNFDYYFITCQSGATATCSFDATNATTNIPTLACTGGAPPATQTFVACAGGKPGLVAKKQHYWINNLNNRDF